MSWERAGGVALAIGGLMWIVKDATIRVGVSQPPIAFSLLLRGSNAHNGF